MKKIIAKIKHEWNSLLYFLMFKKKNKQNKTTRQPHLEYSIIKKPTQLSVGFFDLIK